MAVTASSVSDALFWTESWTSPPTLGVVLAGTALLLRRVQPVAVAAVVVVSCAISAPVYALLIVVYDLMARGRRLLSLTAVAGSVACARLRVELTAADQRLSIPGLLTPRSLSIPLLALAAIALGYFVHSRRRLIGELGLALHRLQADRELRERAIRLTERADIAREMHDVLGHRLSTIALHAGALIARADSVDEPIRERLQLLRTAARDSLQDLRHVLGALHEPGRQEPAQLSPATVDLAALLDGERATGRRVEWLLHGDPEAIPMAHRLALYRVLQEALTNARKHSPDSFVFVTVEHGDT